jgi:hypothetical protein
MIGCCGKLALYYNVKHPNKNLLTYQCVCIIFSDYSSIIFYMDAG